MTLFLHHRAVFFRTLLCLAMALLYMVPAQAQGIVEPVLTDSEGVSVHIPHTDQADDSGNLNNIVGSVVTQDIEDTVSLLGHQILRDKGPNDDMKKALKRLSKAARKDDTFEMVATAQDLRNILMGTTEGRIYDGFAMLNFNRGAYVGDHLAGEYKMKVLCDTGESEIGILGDPVKIWELDVNLLYYDGQIDSDTFLMRVPLEVGEFDTVRINYTIRSTEREEFSPTVVMLDRRTPGSVAFPHKGFDSVWVPFGKDEQVKLTVAYPPVRMMRGVYTWGWRVHPPRIQFLQPVYEIQNAHTGSIELDPQGHSFAVRNASVSLDDIGDAAPEKKMYIVANAVLTGSDCDTIHNWMNLSEEGPAGTWREWANLASDERQIPQEAWDILASEGIDQGDFGPYQMISVYMNNELYGEGPEGSSIEGWNQGDQLQVKLINLDNHTHYFRNVDFGPGLHDDIADCCSAGSHSFEIMNFKPSYGAPKVAEMQYRAGWGFRPHFDVIQQEDVFPRFIDQVLLKPYSGGDGQEYLGYQYSAGFRGGDFRFNPPPFIIGSHSSPAAFPLREEDGSNGLVIGQTTEGYGTAKMCEDDPTGFCQTDFGPYNPHGVLNWPAPNDPTVPKTELRFPPFLRNPGAGGDIIPPTVAWKPFLWLSPYNGTLYIDPADPTKGWWADLTYAHGTPIQPGADISPTIEATRASGQVFYQFDDLFHDNAIFSPHPVD